MLFVQNDTYGYANKYTCYINYEVQIPVKSYTLCCHIITICFNNTVI